MKLMSLAAGSMLALCGAAVRADVLTVGPGGTFSAIQPAVDAAADGDTILVHAGTYAAFRVDQKSLAIAVDPVGASVTTGNITVANLAAGQRCLLSGFHVSTAIGPALNAHDNMGSLRCEGITNAFLSTNTTPGDAASIRQCADVALTRCTLTGSAGHPIFNTFVNPGQGLTIVGSNVAVYDCSVQGGDGSDGHIGDEGLPVSPSGVARGCSIDGGQIFCSGTSIVGGLGGHGASASCGMFHYGGDPGANGGAGLVVTSGIATVLDTLLVGGAGGAGGGAAPACSEPGGADGVAGPGSTGPVNTLPGAHKTLVATTLVRESMQLDVTVDGAPGDSVWLSIARDSRWVFTAARKGVTLVGPHARNIFLGTIPASGSLAASFPIGELGPGVQASTLLLQALCIDSSGRSTLTGSDFVVLLDSMF